VWTELPTGRYATLVAKIAEHSGDSMKIQYLSPTITRRNGQVVYNYEDVMYDITDESVTEYMDDMDETDLGYKRVDEGFVKYSSDSDYIPTDDESTSSSDSEDNYIDE